MDEEPFYFEVTKVLRETQKALLVESDELNETEVWIPKSQIHDNSEVWKSSQEGKMAVTQWLARKNGWVDD